MAIDEAISRAVQAGLVPPTLRFFGWNPACLSLGQAQPGADVDREACRDAGVDVVRRPTGGRAILHTDELTYSVIAPDNDSRVVGTIVESYRRLSGMIIEVPRSQSSSYTSTILLVGRPLTLTEPREKMSFRSLSPSLTTAR